MQKILFFVAIAAAFLFAKNDETATEFSHAAVALEGGALYLLDDAQQGLDDTYYGLLEFDYNYFQSLQGVIQFGYSYLPTKKGVSYDGVHMVVGRIGLDYPIPFIQPVAFGAGFTCIWMRADGDDEANSSLYDNESEFGFYARLNLPILTLDKWRLGAKIYFERLWTSPETSESGWFGFYLQRQIR